MKLLPAMICLFLISGCSVFGGKKKGGSRSGGGSDPAAVDPAGDPAANTATSMKFKTPGDATQKVVKGASYDVVVEFINASATASWSLFYTATKDSVVGALPILEDLPVATTTVSWDTSFVDPGVYYLYAVFTSEGVTNIYFAPGSFKFEGNSDLNKAPVATIASPDGDRTYAPGAKVPITFSAVDADDDPLDIKIEFTSDGSLWESIAEAIDKDTNQYEWDIPTDAVQSARYRIRVVASDGKQSGEALNLKVFGVTAVPVIYTAQVQTLLNAKCATSGCHEGMDPSGGLNLSTYAPANTAKQSILTRTRVGAASPMPPANDPQGRKLTAEERDLIQLWIWNNGAQN